MIDGKPLMRSMMGERIWSLMQSDPEEFKRETRAYFARGYPGWTVVKVKYPIVYLRDERGRQG
ncbi:hypothetical protein J2Z18_002126 [Paenibacillus lactis]|uniref:Uncharacterized protein n=1 Tax=Paenibacillus lactis TaxID=228574 RepID=A0ABS4F9U1_9BACL|nr:hypothetical protein [Paenibacillus lactis]HAF97512.1 hypothetical protein [Paenibacillus lactis]